TSLAGLSFGFFALSRAMLSALDFLLPLPIEARAVARDQSHVVPAFAQKDWRHLVERQRRAGAIAVGPALEAQVRQGNLAVFLGQPIAAKAEHGLDAHGREPLAVGIKPATILGRTAHVIEFAGGAAQLVGIEHMPLKVAERARFALVGGKPIGAFAELLEQRRHLVVGKVFDPGLARAGC